MAFPRSLPLVALALFVAFACQGPPAPEVADLVVTGGRIITVHPEPPEVRALAAKDGRILVVGSEEEVAPYIGAGTEVIELGDNLAIPGFIEGHGHFLGIGQARMQLDLREVTSWQEVIDQVEAAATKTGVGGWIEGRGWHQDKLEDLGDFETVEGLPVHDALSAVSPNHPVVLRHASGHASFANARAMDLAGVDGGTLPPEGGEIVHDAAGEPIGVFRETAMGLVARREPATESEVRRMAELASEECLAKGITSFQDAGTPVSQIKILHQMAEEGRLPLRLWMMIRDSQENLTAALPGIKVTGAAKDHFTVGGIKHSIDGALGSHGAWLLEPYEDLPESTGLNTTPVEVIEASAALAKEHGLQLCVHAIGDRADRETLDLFERTFAEDGAGALAERRWRVEHAQHLHPDDIPRFAELGVIASMQAVHCTSDGPWVPKRIGDRRAEEGAYVWRKLLDSGAVVTNGTDAPVEDVSPVASYYAAVSRRLADGSRFYPDQRMSRQEALESYTLNTAYAAFEEHLKGSLTAGKLADITILDRDIFTVSEDEIAETQIVATIVGGKVAYSRD